MFEQCLRSSDTNCLHGRLGTRWINSPGVTVSFGQVYQACRREHGNDVHRSLWQAYKPLGVDQPLHISGCTWPDQKESVESEPDTRFLGVRAPRRIRGDQPAEDVEQVMRHM